MAGGRGLREVGQRLHHRGVAGVARGQAVGERAQDSGGFGQRGAGFGLRQQGEELQEQRQVVGQFVRRGLEAVAAVERDQVGHRLPAVAAFAVHVLEQMQRQAAAAVEQRDVAFLQVVDVRGGQVGQERAERITEGWCADRLGDFRNAGLQFLRGVGQQGGEGAIDAGHHATSIGDFAFLPPPNRSKPVRPLQPSPKEKPQEPRN